MTVTADEATGKVIVGDFRTDPAVLKKLLKGRHGFVEYHPNNGHLYIGTGHEESREVLFEKENTGRDMLRKLITGLGYVKVPTLGLFMLWEEPWIIIQDDGTLTATALKVEGRTQQLPLMIVPGPYAALKEVRVSTEEILTPAITTGNQQFYLEMIRRMAAEYHQSDYPF